MKLRKRSVFDVGVDRDTYGIDEDIDALPFAQQGVDGRLPAGFGRHVEVAKCGALTQGRSGRRALFDCDVGDHHARAAADEMTRAFKADPRSAAGDEHHLAIEVLGNRRHAAHINLPPGGRAPPRPSSRIRATNTLTSRISWMPVTLCPALQISFHALISPPPLVEKIHRVLVRHRQLRRIQAGTHDAATQVVPETPLNTGV